MGRLLAGAAVASLLSVSCAGSELAPCDPFTQGERSLSLATVLAAGRHSSGTLYVVDRVADGPERVFRSERDVLWLQKIGGGCSSSSVAGGDQFLRCTVGGEFTLKVELRRGGPVKMALTLGEDPTRNFAIEPQDQPLETVDSEVVKRMSVRERLVMHFEYLATLADGSYLAVLHPEWPGLRVEDVEIYLGPPDGLRQRRLLGFERQRDGGTTFIRFDVEGEVATAFFPSALRMSGPPTLMLSGMTMPLTVLPRDERPAGLSFFCL